MVTKLSYTKLSMQFFTSSSTDTVSQKKLFDALDLFAC